jgi:flagellar export protein FliJ
MTGKKFRFSLDQVLQLRTHEVEVARLEMARVLRERRLQEERVAAAEALLHAAQAAAPTSGPHGPARFRQWTTYVLETQQALERERKRLEQCRLAEAEARSQYLGKRRHEESLLALKEQEQATYEQAAQGAEISFLDEQALLTFFRKHNPAD